jgi:hypothetical protein
LNRRSHDVGQQLDQIRHPCQADSGARSPPRTESSAARPSLSGSDWSTLAPRPRIGPAVQLATGRPSATLGDRRTLANTRRPVRVCSTRPKLLGLYTIVRHLPSWRHRILKTSSICCRSALGTILPAPRGGLPQGPKRDW